MTVKTKDICESLRDLKTAGLKGVKLRYRQREYIIELTDEDLLTATNLAEIKTLLQSKTEEVDALEILEATENFPALTKVDKEP